MWTGQPWFGGYVPPSDQPEPVNVEFDIDREVAALVAEVERWLRLVLEFAAWDVAHGGDGRLH